MTNIGSCTASAPVLVYYYASNIVLEESMMRVSFGLTTQTIKEKKVNFLQNLTYQDFIIFSGSLYNQNRYNYVLQCQP